MEMGGLVESQIRQAIYALSQFSVEVANQVTANEARVNAMEVEIDRDLSSIIARRQPTARDLRLLIAISKTTGQPGARGRRGRKDRPHGALHHQQRRAALAALAGVCVSRPTWPPACCNKALDAFARLDVERRRWPSSKRTI